MKAFIAIMAAVGAIVILAGIPAFMNSIRDFRTDTLDETYVVTTNGSTSTGSVQLSKELWEGETVWADISSNLTIDVPVISSYNVSTRNLAFTGLATNNTRNIDIEYKAFRLNEYGGADTGIKIFPTFIVLAVSFIPILIIVFLFVNRS